MTGDAVVELRAADGCCEWPEACVAAEEMCSKAQPETQVAEIDTPEQESSVDFLAHRHESAEQPLDRRPAR